MLTISTFVMPSLWLLSEHPKMKALLMWKTLQVTRISALFGSNDGDKAAEMRNVYTQTVARAFAVQSELTAIMLMSILAAVFGVLLPHLVLLALVAVPLHLFALRWASTYGTSGSRLAFGEVLASNILGRFVTWLPSYRVLTLTMPLHPDLSSSASIDKTRMVYSHTVLEPKGLG